MFARVIVWLLFLLALPTLAAIHYSQVIPPIIVHAKPQHASLTSGPKTIITRQQLNITGMTSTAQALQNLGGIQLQDSSGNGSQVFLSMRGFGGNANSNTLLLLNGIPLTNPDMAPADLSNIPVTEIKYIEVIAGSESVLYGDQAVGGLVNIVTNGQSKEKMALTCTGGSYNQRSCFFTFHKPLNAYYVALTLLNTRTDNYRDRNRYQQNLLSGSINHQQLQFNYQLANETLQYPGALTAAQVRQNRRQASSDDNYFSDKNGLFHLQYKQALNNDWQVTNNLSYRAMQGHGVLSLPFNQARKIYFFKPELKGNIHSVLMMGGLDLEHDDYHLGSMLGLTNNTEQKFGLYSLANIPLSAKIVLSIGARGAQQNSALITSTRNDMINRAFASTLGATYQYSPLTNFYLRRAESFRFPKADETASTATGITGLRTQRGVSYEAGVRYARATRSIALGIYQLNLRDEIAFDPTQTPQQPFGSNTNLAPTLRRGLTLTGKFQTLDKWTVDGQFNFVNARFQTGLYADKRIPLVAEQIMRAGIDYHFQEHWHAYLESIYTGNQYADNDNANIAGLMGGYTVCNFNLRYQFKRFNAALHFNNIFNKNYYLYTVYQTSMQTESFYPAPDRNFVITLNYDFV